jgi:2-oxoglutarate dehydrogenase E2 component (dihydrolipoamide succinyltransferase)
MIIDIVMPKMGESIIEGTILEWRKKVGEPIALDEILLEIGTDKVDSEIPSPNAGVVVEILGEVNQTMDVGVVIARIETDSSQAKPIETIQVKDDLQNIDIENLKPVKVKASKTQTSKKKTINNIDKKKFFTPVVNKIAHENNINNEELLLIPGTGKSGRVTKLDILNYLKTRDDSIIKEIQPPRPSKPVTPSFTGNEAIVEMDHMRKLIANHMRESIDVSAHVYVMSEIDMTNIVNFVKKEDKVFKNKEGYHLTYTPFIIKACVKALGNYPEMNASLNENNIIYHKNINIGMAVAIEKGLMVPVLKNCEELNFLGLCRKVRDFSTRTRNNQLIPDELQGSTFSISNFGVFNVTMGTPIINQPNVGILGVGAVKKRPVVIETEEGDTIGIKSMMILSLGFDHRLVDGAGGSQFIEMVKENIETMNLENIF